MIFVDGKGVPTLREITWLIRQLPDPNMDGCQDKVEARIAILFNEEPNGKPVELNNAKYLAVPLRRIVVELNPGAVAGDPTVETGVWIYQGPIAVTDRIL
jgi:hypothetical protein